MINKKKINEYRFEKKFVFKSEKKIINNLIFKNPGLFYKKYDSRYINNIYFDDMDDSLLDMNVEGISKRFKVRIRWYNDEIKKSILEIKIKNNQKNYKLYVKIDKQINLEEISNNYLVDIIGDNSDICNLEYLKPVIYNRYRRDYYESFLDNIRLTIDTNLNFKNLKFEKKFNEIKNLVIVELKYSQNSDIIKLISNNLKTRMSKFSKYVTCATEDFSSFL